MKLSGASSAEVLEFLRVVPLFSKINGSTARNLATQCRFRQFDKGERIFHESDTAECAFLVRSGKISIILNSTDGRELVIDEMRPGDILGEVGLLTRTSHTASAVARTHCEVLALPRELFLRMIDDEPVLARRILDVTAHRLQRSAVRETALAFLDAQARLARYLLALEAEEHDKGYVTASQEDLARGTGLIRQTVAKVLGRWRRDGWLLTGRGRVLLLNRKALEQIERGDISVSLVSPR